MKGQGQNIPLVTDFGSGLLCLKIAAILQTNIRLAVLIMSVKCYLLYYYVMPVEFFTIWKGLSNFDVSVGLFLLCL